MKSSALVSVIIPVFNVRPYIAEGGATARKRNPYLSG